MLESPDQINFFDPDINDCPYDAYKLLRDEAPIWQDPQTGMFVMTRYEDIKKVLADVAIFTNAVGSAAGMTEKAVKPTDPEELRKWEQAADEERILTEMYEKDGWVPVATLDALDPPDAHGAAPDVRRRVPTRSHPRARPVRGGSHQSLVRRFSSTMARATGCRRWPSPCRSTRSAARWVCPTRTCPRSRPGPMPGCSGSGSCRPSRSGSGPPRRRSRPRTTSSPYSTGTVEHPEDRLLGDLVDKVDEPSGAEQLTDA